MATAEQKEQFAEIKDSILWVNEASALAGYPAAGAVMDLTFEPTAERISTLAQMLPKPVIINSVAHTLQDTHPDFIRINGWASFLSSPFWEAACSNEAGRKKAEPVFHFLGKKVEWLPDTPGFVTARVVSAIINEAYLALEEGVSTKEEINTAMKLGTAYPYGPFEWAGKIGLQNVRGLLEALRRQHPRYTPAGLLVKEAAGAI